MSTSNVIFATTKIPPPRPEEFVLERYEIEEFDGKEVPPHAGLRDWKSLGAEFQTFMRDEAEWFYQQLRSAGREVRIVKFTREVIAGVGSWSHEHH